MKKIKHACVAACVAAMLLLSGCVGFGSFIPDLGDNVKVKSLSLENGITLDIRGIECNFSFTKDKITIANEVKKCLIGDGNYRGLVMAAPAPYDEGPASVVTSTDEGFEAAVVDVQTSAEADKITEDILKAIAKNE